MTSTLNQGVICSATAITLPLQPPHPTQLFWMSRPSHHANASKTLFRNPWQVPEEKDQNTSSTIASSSWLWQLPALVANIPLEWAKELTGHDSSPVKVVKPDFNSFKFNTMNVKSAWLGHAVCASHCWNPFPGWWPQGFLVQMPAHDGGLPNRILFDPVFSDWAGPSSWTCIRRRLPAPCGVEDLPDYNVVLISHNQ